MPRLPIVSGSVPIPEGVTVEVKARRVTVTGPRGTLTDDFSHAALDIYKVNEKGTEFVKVKKSPIIDKYFGRSKQVAGIKTTCSHIRNMITGVTKGFEYRMRLVYAHFPINVNIEKNGSLVEIRNFLGEKFVRKVEMLDGVQCIKSDEVKDELIFRGNSIKNVSRSCALICQSCLVKGNKDIRKFLDGIFVSQWGVQGEALRAI